MQRSTPHVEVFLITAVKDQETADINGKTDRRDDEHGGADDRDRLEQTPDGLLDLMHVTAQGVVAGANMVLVDFHPTPSKALVDAPQALPLEVLPQFIEDVQLVHETYQRRRDLARQYDGEVLKYAEAVAV